VTLQSSWQKAMVPILSGIKLEAEDRHVVEISNDKKFKSVVVPAKSLIEISRILPSDDQFIDIVFSNNQMLVSVPNMLIYSRLNEGLYPDITRIISIVLEETVTLVKDDILSALGRAAWIAHDTYSICIIQIEKDNVVVTSSSLNIGRMFESVPICSFVGSGYV